MSDQTFGAWLLGQGERQDSIGSMSRAWKTLKETRGYKHSQEKSIRQLLSAQLGENWAQMQGDEVMDAAVSEWSGEPAAGNGEQLQIPMALTASTPATIRLSPAILVVDGTEYELTPGRKYVISFGRAVLRDVEGFDQSSEDAQPVDNPVDLLPFSISVPRNAADWNVLYSAATDVPADVDLEAVEE